MLEVGCPSRWSPLGPFSREDNGELGASEAKAFVAGYEFRAKSSDGISIVLKTLTQLLVTWLVKGAPVLLFPIRPLKCGRRPRSKSLREEVLLCLTDCYKNSPRPSL